VAQSSPGFPEIALGDLWKVAAEASDDAIFGIDAYGTVLTWPRSAGRIFGFSADEMIGHIATRLVGPEQAAALDDYIERAINGERIERLQISARRRDGTAIPIALSLVPVGAGGGEVCALAHDLTEQRATQATLVESELRLREAQALSHVGLWMWDAATDALELSDELYTIHRIDPLDFGATMAAYLELIHPADRPSVEADLDRAVRGQGAFRREYRIVRDGGDVGWVYARAALERDSRGVAVGLRGICQDITERKGAAEALLRQTSLLELLRRMAVAANEASNLEQALPTCLRDVCLHTGWEVGHAYFVEGRRPVASGIWSSADPLRYEALRVALDQATLVPVDSALAQVLHEARPLWRTDLSVDAGPCASAATSAGLLSRIAFPLVVDGEVVAVLEFFSSAQHEPDPQLLATVWDGTNQVGRVVERMRARDELSHRALHDSLTGLPNRALLLDRLAHSLHRRSAEPCFVALIFIDLDNFKLINDVLGHEVGDKLLVAVARRLRRVIRPQDTAARFGGDEFIILCDGLAGEAAAVDLTERVLTALAEPIPIHGARGTVISASAGIAVATSSEAVPEDLLRDADAAMYRAKEAGRGRYQIFDSAMHRQASERLSIANELRTAIADGELRIVYQPQISLASGQLVGTEALVCWEHPERGLIGPQEFIEVAEETQLIVPLGAWVIAQACEQAAQWERMRPDGPPLKLCVNVSARQLALPALVEDVSRALNDTGIEPSSLCLEITESVLVSDAEFFMESLLGLKMLGVGLAIDDFGTGYSSLAYLRRYPVDVIKIDKGFVDGLNKEDKRGRAVVAAVVQLAHALGLVAVAEGVETRRQLRILQELGCDVIQGFLIARPLPAAEITRMIEADAGSLLPQDLELQR
jgi:diguanylate cyclase (GGDEF)-like protein/PAS domain S-box-containing protein